MRTINRAEWARRQKNGQTHTIDGQRYIVTWTDAGTALVPVEVTPNGWTVVHCTGCGETFEGPERLIGALCGQGQVRPATKDEGDVYRQEREDVS